MHIVIIDYEAEKSDSWLPKFRKQICSSQSGWKEKMYAASMSEPSVINAG